MSVHQFTEADIGEKPAEQSELSTEPSSFFTPVDVEGFRDQDQEAGRAIARILVSLFSYTVIIMIVVILWTIRTVG